MTPRQAQEVAERLVPGLRNERKWRGMGVRKLAQKSGLAPSAIWDLEGGRRSPRLITLIRWADALGWEVKLVRKVP